MCAVRRSRLSDCGSPAAAANTMTPTGEVSTSASRSARALCSSRCARVGDGDRRLPGKQDQHFLVLVGELLAALLLSEEEVADIEAAVAHRRALERTARDEARRKSERGDMRPEIRHAEQPVEAAQMLERPHRVGPLSHLPFLLGGSPEMMVSCGRGRPASSTVAMTP